MTTTTDTPNIATARAFSVAVAKGETPEVTECRCASLGEMVEMFDLFSKSRNWFAQKGKSVKMVGAGDYRVNGFSVTVGKHTFRVNPPGKASFPKKVTATSKKAYRELDKETLAMRVARAVIELHKEHAFVYDKLVADKMGIDSSTVSARRNEISDAGGIRIDGDTYSLHLGPNTKNPITGKTVQGWALRKPNTLF